MGIKTVAVYSEADAQALHVKMADEAVLLGPAAAAESYLRADKVIEACRLTGAQAVHPGYGFLSENAAFAEALAAAGLVFIGPPVGAIEVMGSKAESKRLMESAGVPLVPGYHGADQSDAVLIKAAEEIGYPVLVKASAGGGGKGMRVVRAASDLVDAMAGARREAKAAFGDDSLLIEKYLDHPRHVEMQVFADTHGSVVHLFERDCSLQRRHQKVIEEAPAPGLPDAVRQALGEAAVAAAKAVNYVGAGTVEFLYQDEQFYFIEMNTRLQVEHPVTEMITGQDLVEWQLRVADGQPLPVKQGDLAVSGHAFEARIYAEDPQKSFLPSIGRLDHLVPPAESAHVRVDTGVVQGDSVSPHYDPMIAKLVVWDIDRDAALARLRWALAAYQVVGVATNVDFLSTVAAHPAFAAVELSTHFIDLHRDALIPQPPVPDDWALAFAALQVVLGQQEKAAVRAAESADPWSPWAVSDGWRMNDDNHHDMTFLHGDAPILVTLHYRQAGCWRIDLPGGSQELRAERAADGGLCVEMGGLRRQAVVVQRGSELVILDQGRQHRLLLDDPAERAGAQDAVSGTLAAPMPGKVIQVLVAEGDKIAKGQALVVLEAMKMEHTIAAPVAGTIAALHYSPGDQVADGAELLVLDPDDAT
jgi:3-methylcrotonyl-CoA carboxylase alpha subunit